MQDAAAPNPLPGTALDAEQRAAVEAGAALVRVLAGPGSGKTRVLAERAARSASKAPGKTLCLCFTRRAAAELSERLAGRVSAPRDLRVETMHAFCLRVLRGERTLPSGLPGSFTLLGAASQRRLVRDAVRSAGLDAGSFPAAEISGRLARRRVRVAEHAARWGAGTELASIGRAFEEALRRSGALDFDGLLIETRALFRERVEARDKWRARIQHLLVDEAQDVAAIEWDILEALVDAPEGDPGGARLFAVGDPDQAIYTWRDGPSEFSRLDERFGGLQTLRLELNYRSAANIVEAADALAAASAERVPRTAQPTRESGSPLFSIAASDPEHEARVTSRVVANALSDGIEAAEIAVLARTHSALAPIEAALSRDRIAYEILGGVPFHERSEVRDVLAYLRLAVNEHDEDAFWCAAAAPKRGIGPVSRARLTAIVAEANAETHFSARSSLVDAISSERVRAQFQGRTRRGLEELAGFLADLRAERADEAAPLVAAVLERLRRTTWLDDLDGSRDGGQREEALETLMAEAQEHDDRHEGSGAAGLVARLTLDGGPHGSGDAPRSSAVRLSTLHGAKGAEFDLVVVCGLADGIVPHGRALSDRAGAGLEEERRLLYVGITRARDQVFLTWPKRRRFGGEGWTDARASRFFGDLPTDLVGRVPPELVDSLATRGGPETMGLSVGDRVEHPHFGEGEVVLFTSRDADARAIVVFDGFGPRELFLRHTSLRRVTP